MFFKGRHTKKEYAEARTVAREFDDLMSFIDCAEEDAQAVVASGVANLLKKWEATVCKDLPARCHEYFVSYLSPKYLSKAGKYFVRQAKAIKKEALAQDEPTKLFRSLSQSIVGYLIVTYSWESQTTRANFFFFDHDRPPYVRHSIQDAICRFLARFGKSIPPSMRP